MLIPFELKLEWEDFPLVGANSLEGLLINSGWDCQQSVRILFPETTSSWKRENNGPHELIVPEFMFVCLSESILSLVQRGVAVSVGTYPCNP